MVQCRLLVSLVGVGEPADEADRGRHPGFARREGLAGVNGIHAVKGTRIVLAMQPATIAELSASADGGLFIGFPRFYAQQAAAAELFRSAVNAQVATLWVD